MGKPQLTWNELKELVIKEYNDEGTAIEAMTGLVELVQLKDKTHRELRAKAEGLAVVAFPEKFRSNEAMQAQMADLYVEAPQNECVQHNVIKEAPVKLYAAVALAKDSQGECEKVKRKKAQGRSRKVDRQVEEEETPMWNGEVKQERVEPGIPHTKARMLCHGFYKHTPGRLGTTC